MKDQNNSQNRNFDIASFKRATEGMISKNEESYGDYDYLSYRRTARTTLKDYKPEEIEQIINSGSLQEQRALSKNYFLKDGIYRAIILYYAKIKVKQIVICNHFYELFIKYSKTFIRRGCIK